MTFAEELVEALAEWRKSGYRDCVGCNGTGEQSPAPGERHVCINCSGTGENIGPVERVARMREEK